MSKHTPGPLQAIKGAEDEPDRWIVCAAGPRPFLVATIENGQPGDTLETEGATARLFAAAPDLLEALKALVKVNEDWNAEVEKTIGRTPNWTDGYLDAARAAIAKAESR